MVANRNRRGTHHALPGATPLKPGSASRPFFGIRPSWSTLTANCWSATSGNLCIADSWPGQMRTVYGDHQRFIETYFVQYPGKYFTGDGAGATKTVITGLPVVSMMC